MKLLLLLFLLLANCAGNKGFFYERSYWNPMRTYKEECKKDVIKTYINGVTYITILNRYSSATVTIDKFRQWIEISEADGEMTKRQANAWRYAIE